MTEDELKYKFTDAVAIELSKADYILTKIDDPIIRLKGKLDKTEGSIDISNLPKGAYVFTVIVEGEVYSYKLVK